MSPTAGFDWLLIDGEHDPNDLRGTLAAMLIPMPGQEAVDLAALKKAGETLDNLLGAIKVAVEDVVTDFEEAPTREKPSKNLKRREPANPGRVVPRYTVSPTSNQ